MKKLLTQIRNEWRSNLWLMIEMLVVSVVMWYIADYMYQTIETYIRPLGFNIDHTYKIGFDRLTDKSPAFIPDQDWQAKVADMNELMERIRRRPEVEAVSLSLNAHPYNGSNSGTQFSYDTLSTKGYVILRQASPEFPIVFQYKGTQGESPEKLERLMEDTPVKIIVSDNLLQHHDVKMTSLVGQNLLWGGDSANMPQVAASIEPVRYSDFSRGWGEQSVLCRLSEMAYEYASELCVRVKADQDIDFAEKLIADSESQFRVGNLYLTWVQPFSKIRSIYQRSTTNTIKSYVIGMAFLLVNIFLGLLGTFWFRTQQRTQEIAVRRVNGATRRSIFGRLIGEGLLLLTIVTPVAILIDINLAMAELFTSLHWTRMIVTVLTVYAVMALMVVAGIYFPARKAMKIDPATALHDE